MSEKSERSLNEILEQLKLMQKERRKDRIFSKIDSLFFVLVTLATFVSGLLVAQYQTLWRLNLLTPCIGMVLTLLLSFAIGFRGMVNDNLEVRMWSWSTLFVSFIWLLFSLIGFIFRLSLENIHFLGVRLPLLANLFLGFFAGFFQVDLTRKFINWAGYKLSSLLNERVDMSPKIRRKTTITVFVVWGISLLLGFLF